MGEIVKTFSTKDENIEYADERYDITRQAVLIKLMRWHKKDRYILKYVMHNNLILSEPQIKNKLNMAGVGQISVGYAVIIYTDDLSCEWVTLETLQEWLEFEKVILHNVKYNGKFKLLNKPDIDSNVHNLKTSVIGKIDWNNTEYYLTTDRDKPFRTLKELDMDFGKMDYTWVPELDRRLLERYWEEFSLSGL